MQLTDTARQRLEDIRELEPTTNGELRDRWGVSSGKEVAAYLREELSEYTYRDSDSRIRAVGEPPDGGTAAPGETENGARNTSDESRRSDATQTTPKRDGGSQTAAQAVSAGATSGQQSGGGLSATAAPTGSTRLDLSSLGAGADTEPDGEPTSSGTKLDLSRLTGGHDSSDLSADSDSAECPKCGTGLLSAAEFQAELDEWRTENAETATEAEKRNFNRIAAAYGEIDAEAVCPDVWECGYYKES